MISPKTAQVIKYCGLFLILLVFLSVDLAFTITVSLYLALSSKNYSKLLVISLVLFVADILFKQLDISIRFISDLSLDSYVLLLTSLFIYLKSQEKILLLLKSLGESHRKLISMHTFAIVGISSIFSLLLAPIIGIPFAVIIGYISFSYFSKHFDGKYAYTAGLFVLFFCPFLIIAKRDDISENLAVISFYFLIIGTVQEIVRIKQVRIGELFSKIKILDEINLGKEAYSSTNQRIFTIIVLITALVSFLVTFFFIK